MDLTLSEEQALLRESARRFIAGRYSLEQLRKVEASAAGWSPANWESFAELGWLALPVPEEAGGLGGGPEDLILLMAEFGRGHVLEPFVSTVVACGHVLAAQGPALLEGVLAGSGTFALALHDAARPPPGADFGGVAASPVAGGYTLSGRKRVVADGAAADMFLVSALLDGEPALFLAGRQAAGMEVTPYKLIDGSGAADIALREARLGGDALLAAGEAATRLLDEAVWRATLALLAQAVGSMERCLELCGDYVSTRTQFGRPIGKFQALQHIMAAMFIEAQEARSALYRAAACAGEPPEERLRALSAAKVVVCEAGRFVTRNGIQLHGGYGLTEEFLIGHHFRRQIVIEKQFGDIDAHLALLAGGLNSDGAAAHETGKGAAAHV